jgi:5'-nucleotidase (lipoprotein e(P4) family)
MRLKLLVPFVFLFIICAAACAETQFAEIDRSAIGKLDAALWMQTSAEYQTNVLQAYRIAARCLRDALQDITWSAIPGQVNRDELKPAIIVDLDETVLDNSRFQTALVKNGLSFSEALWSQWVVTSSSTALPGAHDFLIATHKLGVTIVYVTNRNYSSKEATLKNLQQLDLPVDSTGNFVLCSGEPIPGESSKWESDKQGRREYLAKRYRILLIIGDQLSDFVRSSQLDPQARIALAVRYRDYWGSKWIVIPNPAYGSWEQAVLASPQSLSDNEKLERKYQSLTAWQLPRSTSREPNLSTQPRNAAHQAGIPANATRGDSFCPWPSHFRRVRH